MLAPFVSQFWRYKFAYDDDGDDLAINISVYIVYICLCSVYMLWAGKAVKTVSDISESGCVNVL